MKFRWRELLISFLLAVGVWYIVTGSEKVESQIEVRVDYRGLPNGLVVLNGTVNRVSVRIRASVGMLHSFSGRDFACFVDLSSLKRGENILPIDTRQILIPGGVEIIDVTPSRIYLDVDSVESKNVPLTAEITGDLPEDYTAEVRFSPNEVKISGASSHMDEIDKIVIPVTFDGPVVPGATENRRLIPLPEGVDSVPTETRVSLHISIKRKLVDVTRTVSVRGPDQFGLFVRPDKVKISLAAPVTFASKALSSEDIRAFVQVDRPELGTYSLPVRVALPDGVELVKVEPANVSVTVEQKQSANPRPAAPRARR